MATQEAVGVRLP